MKHFTIALLSIVGLPGAVSAQSMSNDVAFLKQQYEAQTLVVLRPIVLKYAAQLQELRRAAIKRNDLHEALEIEEMIAQLQRDTKVEIPAPIGAAASSSASSLSSSRSDEDMTKAVAGSTWQRKTDTQRQITFREDGGVSSSFGGVGKWKVASPHHVTLYWNNHTRYEFEYDWNLKRSVVNGKEIWDPKQ